MTAIILSGNIIVCDCDNVIVAPNGDLESVNNGKVDGIYPAAMSLTVINNVTLPNPWPGYGYTYANGVFTALPIPTALLNQKKAAYKDDIDNHVGQVRSKYLTVVPGQDMVYQAKRDESTNYLSAYAAANNNAAAIVNTSYPHLNAAYSLGVEGNSMFSIATTWKNTADNWTAVSASIESKRIQSKMGVDSATDEPTAKSYRDTFINTVT